MKYADKLWLEFNISETVNKINEQVAQNSTAVGFIKMAAIGDSQTAHRNNYLKQLAKINTDVKISFNKGLGGRFVSRKELPALAIQAARTKPDILIIQGGANDLMSGVSSDRIIKGFINIINSAKATSPNTRIFLVTMPGADSRMQHALKANPNRKPNRRYPRPETIPNRSRVVNRWIRSKAWDASGTGAVVDLEQILGTVNKPGYFSDYIHYNSKAHSEMALALNAGLGGVDLRKHGGINIVNTVSQIPATIQASSLGQSSGLVTMLVTMIGRVFLLPEEKIKQILIKLGLGSAIVSKNQIFAAMSNAKDAAAPGALQSITLQGATKPVPARMARWDPYVKKWAAHFNVPTAMVYAIMYLESGGNNGKTNKNRRTCTEKGSKTSRYANPRIDVNGNRREEPFKQREGCPQDGSRFGQHYYPIHDHGLMQINDRWFHMDDYMNPDLNIKFGCWQINSHMNSWGAKRDGTDNEELTKNILVSYNCGRSGQRRALAKGRDCNPKYVRLGMQKFKEFGGWTTMPQRNQFG